MRSLGIASVYCQAGGWPLTERLSCFDYSYQPNSNTFKNQSRNRFSKLKILLMNNECKKESVIIQKCSPSKLIRSQVNEPLSHVTLT